MKVIICRGLPGSGRTEWSKEQAKSGRVIRLSPTEMGKSAGYYTMTKYTILTYGILGVIREVIESGENIDVVIDGNNLKANIIEKIARLFEEDAGGYISSEQLIRQGTIEVKDFYISLEEALEYDKQREDPIGDIRITQLWNQHRKLLDD